MKFFEIARQAEIVKLMLEFIFDAENPKDLMRRLLSKRTKVYFSNGTPDQYYKDDRQVLCINFGSHIIQKVWVPFKDNCNI